MKSSAFTFLFTAVMISNASAQPSPSSLPDITLDCYQSFVSKVAFPGDSFNDIAIDGDNFDTPHIRYKLQVIDKAVLKIIEDPTRPALRKEHGKHVSEMTRDFTNKHQIVGWREETSAGLRLFTLNFEDGLFSIADVSRAKSTGSGVTLRVMKCR